MSNLEGNINAARIYLEGHFDKKQANMIVNQLVKTGFVTTVSDKTGKVINIELDRSDD